MTRLVVLGTILLSLGCGDAPSTVDPAAGDAAPELSAAAAPVPRPDFVLTAEQTHNKFSSTIPPAITVPSRSVIEAFTHEATGSRDDAYMLCSLAGDLKIAETVDVPHMLVAMHLPKSLFAAGGA